MQQCIKIVLLSYYNVTEIIKCIFISRIIKARCVSSRDNGYIYGQM